MDVSRATATSLPALYAPWIEEVLGGAVPEERHATCSACAMCQPGAAKAATASITAFDPTTKCCTYVPTLPNFLVGMALNDDDPTTAAGRASVERRIAAGIGVTPLGLQPDPHYTLIYKHVGSDLFGRTLGLRCPHYLPVEGGECGIWKHRNAVCATWFCKFERGRVSKRFWDALLYLLTAVERQLSIWAAAKLGEPIDELGPALLPYYATMLNATPCWSQHWAGRAGEFYRESARLVCPLPWIQVREIGGPELVLLAGRLRGAFDPTRLDELPKYLRLGAVARVPRSDDTCAVTGYSSSDMLILPNGIAGALSRFNGDCPTERVCTEIAEDLGLFLDQDTVRKLVDFGVLQTMPTPAASEPC